MTDPSLYNADLAPVPTDQRTWGKWNVASLWVGMAICVPTYTLASERVHAVLMLRRVRSR